MNEIHNFLEFEVFFNENKLAKNQFSVGENGILNLLQCYFHWKILKKQGTWISHSLC